MHADRFVQTVHGKGREGIHLGVAGIARGLGGAHERIGVCELRDDSVRPHDDFADRHLCLLRRRLVRFRELTAVRMRHERSHFENGDHRQESYEQEQQEKEKSDGADVHRPVPLGAVVHAP